ncbi:hypothetical protein BDR05DRAFT_1029382 [Suillus weaverae]|nr:hypothetical protein BDR05DRAFT_1029382 [Suillus weaverae]
MAYTVRGASGNALDIVTSINQDSLGAKDLRCLLISLLQWQYVAYSVKASCVSMSIGHHRSVLFTIHEQSVTVRLDWEITLSAWLSLRFLLFPSFNPPPAHPLHYPGRETRFMQPVPAPSEARPLRTSQDLPPQLHAGPSTGRYMPYSMAFLHH